MTGPMGDVAAVAAEAANAASRRARRSLTPSFARFEEHARDACHVLVTLALDGRRPQGRGGVVHREDRGVLCAGRRIDRSRRAVRLRDARTRHEPPHRVTAEGHDHGRVEYLELAVQVRRARRDLIGLWVTVARRPAFDDVGDEDVIPRPADVAEQVHEEAAGTADERSTLEVLVLARALADEHDLRRGSPSPGTAFVRVAWSRQRVQSRTSAAIASSAARRSASVTRGIRPRPVSRRP